MSGNSYPKKLNNDHLYDLKRSNFVLQEFLKALIEINFKGKVIYTSSIAVYGIDKKIDKKKVNEESKLNPKNYFYKSIIFYNIY